LYKCIKNFRAVLFIDRTIIQYLSTADTDTFIHSFFAPFAGYGNVGTENIYNGCRTNAPLEALYDRVCSLSL